MVTWFRRYREGLLTTLGTLFTAAVATVSGISSWHHIVTVGRDAGEPNAGILPIAIDGLMLVGTVMAGVDRLRGYRTRVWASIDLVIGSVLTLLFNLVSAWDRGLVAMGIAVLFAVTLLASVETMFHPSRTLLTESRRALRHRERVAALPATPAVDAAPVTEPATVPPAEVATSGRPPIKRDGMPRRTNAGRIDGDPTNIGKRAGAGSGSGPRRPRKPKAPAPVPPVTVTPVMDSSATVDTETVPDGEAVTV